MDRNHVAIFSIIAIAFVLVTPSVYAIVEPHIKITMDAGQTTKPFQIVDSSNTEVFSIDVDGTVFPAPPVSESVTTVQSLRHILIGEDTQTSGSPQSIDDQKVLAKWRVDFNSPQIDNDGFAGFPPVYITHFWLSSFIRSDNAEFTNVAIAESFDDAIFTERYTNGDSDTDYVGTFFDGGSDTFCQRTDISEDECFITFGWFIDGVDTGFIRDAIFELGIILPADTTITQVFP